MAITSRTTLQDYCLRRLGHPVIEINVDDEQMSDRMDDALQYFAEYHFDGVEKVFLKHTVTQTDIDNEYIAMADPVISVIRVLPIPNFNAFQTGFFNEEFQLRIQDLNTFSGSSLINWQMSLQNFSMVDHLFTVNATVLFNRKQNKLYLETNWSEKFTVGDVLIIEAYRILDPNTYTEVYDDMFLKKYCTSLIKRQWGENLKKFEGVQLPGGVTLNGKTIYDEAVDEINKIEEEMNMKWELPPDGFIA
tara:strand:+ start:27 stop:770 length:744 start_codon:yes stop_codon:yes gene_type:complete